MLQQILERMYIEPELLEELSEDQKQMLFYKMRQEQVRRWKVHEAKFDEVDGAGKKSNNTKTNGGKKKVEFLKGRDGCEWVWVMGDHPNDKSIEQILEDEAFKEAQLIAEAEAQAQREKEEAELHRQMEEERQRIIKENEEKEARLRKEQEEVERNRSIQEAQAMMERMKLEKQRIEEEEKKKLAAIEAEEKAVRRRSREMAQSMKEKRSSEIYDTLQRKRMAMEKLAEESQAEVETNWKEQEKKAKEADVELRERARKARVDYNESMRRSFTMMQAAQAFSTGGSNSTKGPKPPLPPKKHLMVTSAPGITNKKPRPLRPKNREMIVSWFKKEEKPKKSGLDPETGNVAEWFHGIINRKESEQILEDKEAGAFIVRVSERVWGYTLSYKETTRLKHFLIDASDLGYQFFGADQTIHASLADLVNFHKENAITMSGQEKLRFPCGQLANPPDYEDLFKDDLGTASTS